MNKQTHFFISIYLSHFILERVDVSVVCGGWVETGQTVILTQLLVLTISRCIIIKNPFGTSSASWLGVAQPGVAEGYSPQWGILSLQAGPHTGLPVTN